MDSFPKPHALALLGASGDLTRRKLAPALYLLHRQNRLPAGFRVVGYGRKPLADDAFRQSLRQAIQEFLPAADTGDSAWAPFAAMLSYVSGAYDNPDDLARLAAALAGPDGADRDFIYYLALPPEAAGQALRALAGRLDPARTRLLLEKPFGRDLASARAANNLVARVLPEPRVSRIDHYLAKSAVRNLLVFRFGNVFFEPIWNRHHVDHIQITAAETIGTDGRAGYYDQSGAVRDMLQNHVLAMLALTMMEPPASGRADSLRDRIAETIAGLMPLAPDDFVFGQYEGYRDNAGVAADSPTPTFAAARFELDSWRWRGVPVYVRTGKKLAARRSEIVVAFKSLPACLLGDEVCPAIAPNRLTLRIQPDDSISMSINVRLPGAGNRVAPAALSFGYDELAGLAKADATAPARRARPEGAPVAASSGPGGEAGFGMSEYPLVLWEALTGGSELCWRADGVLAAWREVEPMLAARRPEVYAAGGWGPAASDALLAQRGHRWF